jgi:sporulation protein YlmC with PRC-barrel domain
MFGAGMKQNRRVRDFARSTIYGNDGRLGTVRELYFDDHNWTVRYLLIKSGGWLMGREVHIATSAIADIDDENASMRINLQRKQIEQSPTIDQANSISRQYEETYYNHFQWHPYWQPDTPEWGNPIHFLDDETMIINKPLLPEPLKQSHLRSSAEVIGYEMHAKDGAIGHLDDLIVHDDDWVIRYVQVDTRNRWTGKKMLVPTDRIHQIDWANRSVEVSLTRQAIESAPSYDPSNLITPDYEVELSNHYGTNPT